MESVSFIMTCHVYFLAVGHCRSSTVIQVLCVQNAGHFTVLVSNSLKSHAEYQVLSAALCLIGNICRALRSQVLPYCDDIMAVLLEKLSSSTLHQSLKPQILSLFGDVAIAVGPRFTKHIHSVLHQLSEISSPCAAMSDKMTEEFQNELWQGCLDAYTGIMQVLIDDKDCLVDDVLLILSHVPLIIIIITLSSVNISHSDIKIASCSELIGNLCTAFGAEILPLVDTEAIHKLLTVGRHSKITKTKALASLATKNIKELKGGSSWTDGGQANLRSAAYEALMEFVKNSPRDCYVWVQRTTMIILEWLQHVLALVGHIQSSFDRAQNNGLLSLRTTLQSMLRRMTLEDAPKISDAVVAAVLQMFSSSSGRAGGGVQEDALMTASALVEVLGDKFVNYMDAFRPFLAIGLKNHAECQVCSAAAGLISDICRALGSQVLPFCDDFMKMLLENLGNNNLHRSVKPQILSVFGDIALAIGPEFKKFLEIVLQTLAQASVAYVDKPDYEMVEYLNDLREACLEAYTGIVQGLKGDQIAPNADVQLLLPHVPHIISFISSIAIDSDHSDTNIASSAGLIGDLCTAFGVHMLPLVDTEPISELLSQGRHSKTTRTKTLASWATKEIKKLKGSASW
ncbi:hypothetical protein V5799_003493 [Amblyomma americanum]|uniref:Importin subunit beta-1/Transportin-1-like TPR repeats domain-containing protein n=1 Tax=Amblyomma americanum TaxID=6943 RepID=A0AAQ4D8T4_AMBAM